MVDWLAEERDAPLILHCFADIGVESEVLGWYGDVLRVGIDIRDTNESIPLNADAHVDGKSWEFPLSDDVRFDFGLFHPVCSKWAATTSISGDPDDHVDMIPSARSIARDHCVHFAIENVPRAPLIDPVVLDGRMFGLPIEYERAFETNFEVPRPPRYKRFWGKTGDSSIAETSSFFFTERSREWWASAKGYPPRNYSKQHLAKNTIPAPYIQHVLRAWLAVYEEGNDIDYSDYDRRMETERRGAANRKLREFLGDRESEHSGMPGSSDFEEDSSGGSVDG